MSGAERKQEYSTEKQNVPGDCTLFCEARAVMCARLSPGKQRKGLPGDFWYHMCVTHCVSHGVDAAGTASWGDTAVQMPTRIL